jgi:sulfonate transport system substrate-binding protein
VGVALSRRGIVLSSLALAACARPAARGWPTLRIGYQKNGVLLLAKALGQLSSKMAGVGVRRVEWAEFGSGPPLLEAMRAGAIDVGAVGDTPPIFAQAAGSPILYAAAQPLTGTGQGLLVPQGSTARSVADLKGRKIGFTKGSSAHLFIVQALATARLRLDDITPVYLTPADAAAAFANGALDGWAIWDPYFAIAQETQRARLLLDGRAVAHTNSFFIASRRLADAAPGVLNALLDALSAVAAWGNGHPREWGALVHAATGLPETIVATTLRRGPLAVTPMSPSIVQDQQTNADAFLKLGVIPASVDVPKASWTGWRPAALEQRTPS